MKIGIDNELILEIAKAFMEAMAIEIAKEGFVNEEFKEAGRKLVNELKLVYNMDDMIKITGLTRKKLNEITRKRMIPYYHMSNKFKFFSADSMIRIAEKLENKVKKE